MLCPKKFGFKSKCLIHIRKLHKIDDEKRIPKFFKVENLPKLKPQVQKDEPNDDKTKEINKQLPILKKETVKKFKCLLCPMKFGLKSKCLNHIHNEHNIDDENRVPKFMKIENSPKKRVTFKEPEIEKVAQSLDEVTEKVTSNSRQTNFDASGNGEVNQEEKAQKVTIVEDKNLAKKPDDEVKDIAKANDEIKCTKCAKIFSTAGNLKRHVTFELNNFPY